ncbi:MAG TPA: thiopurine S-methyltransferase [Phycisphaerales bacterium]|nr:thiopurine S-methyltransferase [Phycisphaerales bacterium]
MNPEFWHERWEHGEIGFHQAAINPHLEQHWPRLNLPAQARVFVPLCGKSLDMLWLAGEGHRVVGVELSERAVEAFFRENDLLPEITDAGAFRRYAVDEIEILCGDFFDLDRRTLGPVEAVFDRASLVALPPAMRERYVAHMVGLLDPAAIVLLVTFDYPQAEMDGPPFAVTEAEVRHLYQADFDVQPLAAVDILAEHPRFHERGLTRLDEVVFVLGRQSRR